MAISKSYNDEMEIVYLKEILEIPRKNNWDGAEITNFLNDVYLQYEFASRMDFPKNMEKYYSDILSQLIKNYGH
jgi:hypothetical protein|tara:strand:+ start:2186 stop:2407 length:222 start_codon:yes stop_codon:yes gene_type:complete